MLRKHIKKLLIKIINRFLIINENEWTNDLINDQEPREEFLNCNSGRNDPLITFLVRLEKVEERHHKSPNQEGVVTIKEIEEIQIILP